MKLCDQIRYLREVEGSLRGLGRAMTQGELVRAIAARDWLPLMRRRLAMWAVYSLDHAMAVSETGRPEEHRPRLAAPNRNACRCYRYPNIGALKKSDCLKDLSDWRGRC